MKTKEAIEFMLYHISDFKERTNDDELFDREECNKFLAKANNVVTLLQQGEKYEKIFNTILNWTMHDGEFIPYNVLVDLKQKYFPKGDNNEYERSDTKRQR